MSTERTIATIENMREAESRGKRCMAYSPNTGEQFSATSADYFNLPEGKPLVDADGEPLILAVKVTRYLDALTGEDLLA